MKSKLAIKCEEYADDFKQKGYEDEYLRVLNLLYIVCQVLLLVFEGFVVMCGYNFIFPIWLHIPPLNLIQALAIRLLLFFTTYKVTQEDFMDFSIYYKITKLVFRFKVSLLMVVVMFFISLFI